MIVYRDDEGSELVTKRGNEFKLPYPIIDLDPADVGLAEMELVGSSGNSVVGGGVARLSGGGEKAVVGVGGGAGRGKKTKGQLRDYMQASRKRKAPYREVYADINEYALYASGAKGTCYPYVDGSTIGDVSSELMYSFGNYAAGLAGGSAAAAAAGDYYYSSYPAAAFATACAVYPSMTSHDAWYQTRDKTADYSLVGGGGSGGSCSGGSSNSSSYYSSLSSHYQQLQQQYAAAGIYDVNSASSKFATSYGRPKYGAYDSATLNGYRYGLHKFLEASTDGMAVADRYGTTTATYDTTKLAAGIGDCSMLSSLTSNAIYGMGLTAVDSSDLASGSQQRAAASYASNTYASSSHHQLSNGQQRQQIKSNSYGESITDVGKSSASEDGIASTVATTSTGGQGQMTGACYASVIRCVSPRLRHHTAAAAGQSPSLGSSSSRQQTVDDQTSEAAAYPSTSPTTRTTWLACQQRSRQQQQAELDASTAPHLAPATYSYDAPTNASSCVLASGDKLAGYADYCTMGSSTSTGLSSHRESTDVAAMSSTAGQTSVIHSLRSLR